MLSHLKQRPWKVLLIIMAVMSVMSYSMTIAVPVFADDASPPPSSVDGQIETASMEEPAGLPPADESVEDTPVEKPVELPTTGGETVDTAPVENTPVEEPAELPTTGGETVDTALVENTPVEEPAELPTTGGETVDTALVENTPVEEPGVAFPSSGESVDVTPMEESADELNPTIETLDDTSINDISLNPDDLFNSDDLSNPDDLFQLQPTDTSTSSATQDQTTLGQIPENTTIAVMVDGQAASLASQDAADAILLNDPMWCPTGKLPGEMGCTAKYSSVTALINNLGVMSGPGTIYFTPVYSNPDVTFDHSNVNLKNLDALTIQGGWNGLNNGFGYALSGVTTFNAPVTINWNDTRVTINDITITGAVGTGLTVTSSGNIVLSNVQANNNSGNGASLDNSTGSGYVTLHGAGTFNNNARSGLKVSSNGAVSLDNITASNNTGGHGAYLIAQGTGKGVTLNGMNVFNNNLLDGLYIDANGDIIINSVTANSNGSSGLFLQSTANVTVNCCTHAANNGGTGAYADLPGIFFLRMGNFSGNDAGEYMLTGGGKGNIKYCSFNKRKVNPNKDIDKLTHKVILTSEQTVPLECAAFNGTMLILPNGDSAYLPCPISKEASLASLTEDDLEDTLPEGITFASGFNLQITTEAGAFSIGGESAFANVMITISFVIPEDLLGTDLAILFWNESKWVEVEGAVIENDHITAQVNYDGLFAMAAK